MITELTKLHEFTSLFKLLFHVSIYIVFLNPILIRFILTKIKSKKNLNFCVISATLIEILAFVPTIILAVENDIMLAVMTVIFYYFADFWTFWPVFLLLIIVWLLVKLAGIRKQSRIQSLNNSPIDKNDTNNDFAD